jgi:hypothetical protein
MPSSDNKPIISLIRARVLLSSQEGRVLVLFTDCIVAFLSNEMQHPMLPQSPPEPHMMPSRVAKSPVQYLLLLVDVPQQAYFSLSRY